MPIALPLVALDVLVVALWVIAAALAIALIMDKLSSILAGVPWVGGKLSDAVQRMAQAITNACGHLMSGIDSLIGAAWHHLSRYLDHLWSQFATHAHLIAHLAQIVASQVITVSGVRALAHQVARLAHGIEAGVKTFERKFHGIEHRVKAIERELAKGIGADVLPKIRSLDRRLTHVIHDALPAIRHAEADAQAAIDNLYEWAKGKASLIGIGTFATAVATAIGLEAWNLIRCSLFRNRWGSRGCGLWQGLDDLLGLFFDAVIFADFCGLLPEAEALFGELEAPLVGLVASAADAACAHPPQGWVELSAPALSLPAVYYTGPVPGN